ncbi:MAG: 2-succinyl-6-hydroxy-2,4-cyclohexadiene-1-carboxylate synthase [Elainellaceae cyanobacterium]
MNQSHARHRLTSPNSRHIVIGDYSFHVLDLETSGGDTGCAQASQRPPLVFLHGFMGSSEDWLEVMQRLGDRHRCIAVDLPGHGQTQVLHGSTNPDHPAFQMALTTQALVKLLDQLAIPICDLVGYSMGGRLALYLAIHYPHRVRRLVLESASPGLATEQERQARRQHDEHLAQRLETEDFEAFLEGWYRQPLFARLRHHPNFDSLWQRRLRNRPLDLGRSLRQMGTGQQPSLWNTIQHHSQATLLLAGEADTKFRAIATQMSHHCPAMTSTVIPNCGHTVHAEQPDAFTRQVKEFLRAEPSFPLTAQG